MNSSVTYLLQGIVLTSSWLFAEEGRSTSDEHCSWMLEEYIETFDAVGLAKRLDLAKVNKFLLSLQAEPGVVVEKIAEPFGKPVYKVRVKAREGGEVNSKAGPMRVLLTAGVHGNEPIGVTASLQVLAAFLDRPRLRENFDLTLIIVNPPSLAQSRRRTPKAGKDADLSELGSADIDLNRNFRDVWPPEYDPIRVAIQQETFDIGLDLHGGPKRTEFFLIKGKEDGDFTRRVLQSLHDKPLLESQTGNYDGFVAVGANPKAYRMLSPGESISASEGTLKSFMQNLPTWWSGTLEYSGRMEPASAHAGLFRMAISVLWHARQTAPKHYRGVGSPSSD